MNAQSVYTPSRTMIGTTLPDVAATHATSVAAVSLAWLRGQDPVGAPIASARTVEQVGPLVDSMRLALDPAEVLAGLNEADERFHKTLIELADHALLLSVWSTLALRVRQIMALRNRQNDNLAEVALNHPPIVTALKAGDLDGALSHIARHVASAADLSLELVAEGG